MGPSNVLVLHQLGYVCLKYQVQYQVEYRLV